jgi:type IV pilus assembly protein PilO
MALTGQDVLNQLNKVTLPQMLIGLAITAAAVTAGVFFLLIQPMEDDIGRRRAEHTRLEKELIDKTAIANNLDQSKRDMAVLERRLAQALTELPNESNIDDLIRSLSEIGTKSGLTINSIDPQAEQRQSFYAAIPIVMSVTGNYHEIGVFLDALSKLARIVNVTNIKMGQPRVTSEKLIVNATYVATTFRFLPETTPPKAAK